MSEGEMPLTARFRGALAYAAELHNRQVRKGSGVPYVAHLLSVCALVLEHGGGEDDAIAALLHDAVEDQDVSVDEIRQRYGDTVARIVAGCTDAFTRPKPPWKERKERYLAHLPEADARTRRVSCADKLHNARSVVADYRLVGEQVWERFNAGREPSLWYYRALADTFKRLDPGSALALELDRTVRELEELVQPGQRA